MVVSQPGENNKNLFLIFILKIVGRIFFYFNYVLFVAFLLMYICLNLPWPWEFDKKKISLDYFIFAFSKEKRKKKAERKRKRKNLEFAVD